MRVADEHFGGISAELSGRRGRVTGTDSPQPGWTEITSQVPMAEMDGFESRHKSLSSGDGRCSIAFSAGMSGFASLAGTGSLSSLMKSGGVPGSS